MLLVFGPRSATYDFGPGHPLTPRRFGPGIDLLRAVGAEPGLAPEPAPDRDLLLCHGRSYLEVVKRFSISPFGPNEAGIGEGGDDPPFAGMHGAGAMVAGGTLRALEAILRGDEEHAFHPGGGLHHAMRGRASGFCIYNDPALAIARARIEGLRVLYVDLDVHHGDGVQAIHWDDPGVLTLSFHESGRYLFPGTGGVGELGDGAAAGTAVNVPLEPGTGERAWLDAVRTLVPELAAAFGPDLIVSQHGADSHAWDPLAHLRVTTTAMGEAARLIDAVAHRYSDGRWLATGGGGYDAYRVVPRTWSHVWLAGAHREAPVLTPAAWQDRWAGEAARFGQAPLPPRFDDEANAGLAVDAGQLAAEARSFETTALVRGMVVPRLVREARDRGWWDPLAGTRQAPRVQTAAAEEDPVILHGVTADMWAPLTLAHQVVAPSDPTSAHWLILGAIRVGALVSAAVVGGQAVGVAVTGLAGPGRERDLLALGVAPAFRRRGVGSNLLTGSAADAAEIAVGERDPFDPLPIEVRRDISRRLLRRAGFTVDEVRVASRGLDHATIRGTRGRSGSARTR